MPRTREVAFFVLTNRRTYKPDCFTPLAHARWVINCTRLRGAGFTSSTVDYPADALRCTLEYGMFNRFDMHRWANRCQLTACV